MRDTFGSKLHEFSKSIDILEDDNFEVIQEHIETYLREVLKIKYVRLMLIYEMIDGQFMLQKYVLNRTGKEESLLFKDRDGNYNGQMAYALGENKKLWITAKEEGVTLEKSKGAYVDSWSGCKELPEYKKFDQREEVLTSIIIPLKRGNEINENNRIFGVVNFESQELLPKTSNATKELSDIAFALGKLFQLHEGRKFQQANTVSVINNYKEMQRAIDEYDKEYFYKQKPNIFFAFSSRADKEVVDSIKSLLNNEFSEKFELKSWDDPVNVGFITLKLLKDMSKSEYLICYLSEEEQETMNYKDNPNVLVELGFFMGKNREYHNCSNIIVVREKESNSGLPFDIRDIFILDVPRDKSKNLESKLFKEQLTGKINSSLNSCEL